MKFSIISALLGSVSTQDTLDMSIPYEGDFFFMTGTQR